MGISSRAIVADISGIRPFLEIYPFHKFRNDGIHVRVTFAVRVRRQIQRHSIKENGEVCSVVEIEAAKKILIGLTAASVLCDDHARNPLQDLPERRIGRSWISVAPTVPWVADSA